MARPAGAGQAYVREEAGGPTMPVRGRHVCQQEATKGSLSAGGRMAAEDGDKVSLQSRVFLLNQKPGRVHPDQSESTPLPPGTLISHRKGTGSHGLGCIPVQRCRVGRAGASQAGMEGRGRGKTSRSREDAPTAGEQDQGKNSARTSTIESQARYAHTSL